MRLYTITDAKSVELGIIWEKKTLKEVFSFLDWTNNEIEDIIDIQVGQSLIIGAIKIIRIQ